MKKKNTFKEKQQMTFISDKVNTMFSLSTNTMTIWFFHTE
jgi:hypothetical protein